MLFECASVTAISAHAVELQSIRGSACARCARGEGCGGGIIGKLAFRRDAVLQLDVDDASSFRVGQQVEVAVDPGRFVQVTAALYLLPLMTLLLGALLGDWILTSNAGGILGALVGLVSGWLVLRRGFSAWLARRLRPSLSAISPRTTE